MARLKGRAVRIAVDLLGGDQAPAVVVDGALQALSADPDLHLVLVGPQQVVGEIMADRIEVRVATSSAVRGAVETVRSGQADAAVSAGPTGDTVTAAVAVFGRIPGVLQPALAAVIPAGAGPLLLLDVGASPDPLPEVLAQHARLAVPYACVMLGIAAPRVALLSIGEDGKGDKLRREVAQRLADATLPAQARFVGNVEGHDVPLGGKADVVVTDGFTGNVLLKGIEGAVELVGGDVARGGAPRGAVLLGVGGVVVVCHGAAAAGHVASGIGLAARVVRDDAVTAVRREEVLS